MLYLLFSSAVSWHWSMPAGISSLLRWRRTNVRRSPPTARRSIRSKAIIPAAGLLLLIQGLVEIVRCVICLRTGDWPSREEDVEEVDVDKLKAMVRHIPVQVPTLAHREHGNVETAQGTLVRAHHHGGHRAAHADPHAVEQHDPWATYGLMMLALVVVAIMLGFPTAFTLMGMGVIFAFIAYFAQKVGPQCRREAHAGPDGAAHYGVMTNEVLISIPLFVSWAIWLNAPT